MKLATLPILLLLTSTLLAQSSAPCTVKSVPKVRGLALRQSKKKVADRIKRPWPPLMITSLGLQEWGAEGFEGVQALWFEFEEDRLYVLGISYSKPLTWKHIDEFARSVSNETKLPFSAWVKNGSSASMTCKGFEVTLSLEATPNIKMVDLAAKQRKLDRQVRQKVFTNHVAD